MPDLLQEGNDVSLLVMHRYDNGNLHLLPPCIIAVLPFFSPFPVLHPNEELMKKTLCEPLHQFFMEGCYG